MTYKLVVTTMDGKEIANNIFESKDDMEVARNVWWTKKDDNPINSLTCVSALIISTYQSVTGFELTDTRTYIK